MKDNTTKIGGAFLIGAMIGAAIALLYAPKSGRETRKDITRAARRVKNSTVDLIEDAIDDVNGFVSDLRAKAADIVDQGVDLSAKAKKEIVITLEHGQKVIEKQRKKLSEALGLSDSDDIE
ncbi:MAG: YtxH domain-containing protein [Syntrophales bacterium LBB04]|nr:YtxH domain-containing protein [Syntrophales bacterium LBB04]